MRRAVRLVAGVLMLGTAAVGLFTSGVRADEGLGSGFQSLSLSAVAGAQRILADAPAGQSPGSVDSGVPDAEAQMTGSTSRAFSSAAWPTALVGNAGSLLYLLGPTPCVPGQQLGPVGVPSQCSPVPVPQAVLDQYHFLNTPVRAEAQYPARPQATNAVPGATMTARTSPAKAEADALVGAATAVGVEAFGTTHAASSVEITGPAKAVANATSEAANLNIGAGIITVASVTSTAKGITDGKLASSTGMTTVHDMKVQGVPVFVDDKGVHAGTADVPDAPATGIVNQILSGAKMKVYLTKPTTSSKAGSTSYDAGSLIIVWDTGNNKDATFVFGGATILASASLPFGLDSTGIGGPNASGIPASPGADVVPPGAGDVRSPQGPAGATGQTGAFENPASGGPALAGPRLTAANLKLPKGIHPIWAILALLGAALVCGGLRRLPDRIFDQSSTTCRVGRDL